MHLLFDTEVAEFAHVEIRVPLVEVFIEPIQPA